MNYFTKQWSELTFADNFIFCKVMQDESLCKEMIETLLGIEIKRLVYTDTEHQIESYYGSRGIRLDVYVEGEHEGELKVFDLEMQTGNYDDLMLRTRYYQSLADSRTTRRRTLFKNLRETFIIFICKDDPFGLGLPCYTKYAGFLESDAIKYNDKTHALFYNASAWEKEGRKNVGAVLRFIAQNKATSEFSSRLEDSVQYAKSTPEQEKEYMYFIDALEEAKEEVREAAWAEGLSAGRAEGMAAGRAEGKAAGRAEGRIEGVVAGKIEKAKEADRNLKQSGVDVDIISKCVGLSLEEIERL